MSTPAPLTIDLGPEWMAAEMPPGFGTRLAEIQRLTADLYNMTRFGRLLYDVGPRLAEAVADMLAGLGFETRVLTESGGTAVAARVDNWNRLLFNVSSDDQVVQKKSPEIARVFHLLHEVADDNDHVVLVTNNDPGMRPAGRGPGITPDAQEFLTRMGASHVPSSVLFALWKLSLEKPERAREQFHRLQTHAGGTFELPLAARV